MFKKSFFFSNQSNIDLSYLGLVCCNQCDFNFFLFFPLSSPFNAHPLHVLLSLCHDFSNLLTESCRPLQPTMLKKTLQCLEGIHLSQSGSLLMLYVDKLLSTPFRVLARMVDTLACRRVEMLLAETLQV